MTMLREILGEQTKTLLAQQREARGEIRSEIRTEIRALEQTVKGELQTLERSCTSQFQDLQQGVQSAERGIHEVKTAQTGFERRLKALESRGSEAGTVASSTGAPRRTALVLGGWDPDTAATDMLKNAQALIRELRLDLDTEDMIVPGVRRGLAILPFKQREGETEEAMKERLQDAMSKVRAANYLPAGRDRAAWLTYSRTFAERRRAALAGRTKRLILQLGGGRLGGPQIEVEWGSGTVWLGGQRVASAASAGPPHAEKIPTGGWIDLAAVAQGVKIDEAKVRAEWEPIARTLK